MYSDYATSVVDVGVTVAGLQYVVSPNWVYGGAGRRYALDDLALKQRAGRVGRTNNGVFVLLRPATESFPEVPQPDAVSGWREALSAGISPVLGWEVDPHAMSQLFGLSTVTDDQKRDFARVSHMFLSNFRRIKALELEQATSEPLVGQPAVLVPVWSDHRFSASVPQDLSSVGHEAIRVAGRLLKAMQDKSSVTPVTKEKIAKITTGPIWDVATLIRQLYRNPSFDTTNNARFSYGACGDDTEDFESEMRKIYDLLEQIKMA